MDNAANRTPPLEVRIGQDERWVQENERALVEDLSTMVAHVGRGAFAFQRGASTTEWRYLPAHILRLFAPPLRDTLDRLLIEYDPIGSFVLLVTWPDNTNLVYFCKTHAEGVTVEHVPVMD